MRSATVTAALLLTIGALLTCAAPAAACFGQDFERTIFFELRDIESGVDGEAILDVTIAAITATWDHRTVVVARLNRIIKGPIGGDYVQIALARSSCDRGLAVGVRGFVVGKVVRNPQGDQELVPISERFLDRDRRRQPGP